MYNNFQGNYSEHVDADQLFSIKQDLNENLREFFKCFGQVRCQVKDINETTIINASMCGLRKGPITEYNAQKPIRTVEKLFDKMKEYARAEKDSVRWDINSANRVVEVKVTAKAIEESQPRKYQKGQKGHQMYNIESDVEDGFTGGSRGRGRERGHDEAWCEIHSNCEHATRECYSIAANLR